MKSGSADGTDNSSIIYRGVEDIFGNLHQFVDGINIKDYQAYVCYDKNQYESDKYDGCYQPIGYKFATKNSGFISKVGYDSNHPLFGFPIEQSGSSNTCITDSLSGVSGQRVLMVGSRFNGNFESGLWGHRLNESSSDQWIGYFSGRLIQTNES